MQKPFAVLNWGSHPDEKNDDCWTGEDFATLEEALVAFNLQVTSPDTEDTAYIELDGPDAYLLRKVPGYDPVARRKRAEASDREWRQELAMEAGMLHGVEAYNEMMGWGPGEEE